MRKNKLQKNNKGFTLIELMVATSIFMMVMLVAMGSLVTTSDAAKKSQTLNFTMDNLSFAIESMSRSLRMGTNYTCSSLSIDLSNEPAPNNCENGGNIIAFIPAGKSVDSRMAYKLTTINGINRIQRCDTDTGSCVDIISSNIKIEDDGLRFFVNGTQADDLQPSIYMILKGAVDIKGELISFAIQTMISQRSGE